MNGLFDVVKSSLNQTVLEVNEEHKVFLKEAGKFSPKKILPLTGKGFSSQKRRHYTRVYGKYSKKIEEKFLEIFAKKIKRLFE